MRPEIRALFPGASEQVYLDIAARCLVPTPVRDAIEAHLRVRMHEGGDKDGLWAVVEGARGGLATLIGADPEEIAVTKNVSEGLNLFAASLPWREGDNVVVCPKLEHPNNIYLWYNLKRLRGIEVRTVEPIEGRVSVAAMSDAMDERTRLVTVPSVSFAPGFVTDVEGIVRAARRVGALTLIDAAQSVGAMVTDVRQLGADALAVAAQKCLLADYGTGFLYVRKEVAHELVPVHVARYGIDLGDAHETAFSESGELRYMPGALRFDVGNYNYMGAAAAGAAIGLLSEWTVEAVEDHVGALAARLARGLFELGLPVVGGPDCTDRAHIVSVGESGGGRHYTADDPAMNDLRQALLEDRTVHSIRSGVLRFSVGVHNDDDDIERTLDTAKRWREAR
jgi:cysteine desulfurase/selenocysteine lyase